MPIQGCNERGRPGYKYGKSGKCYIYTRGNETSRKKALAKAQRQEAAVKASGYKEE